MSTCERAARVGVFADGELSAVEHREFQDHLADCNTCIQELGEVMEVDAAAARVMRKSGWGEPALVSALLLALFVVAVAGMLLARGWS